MNTKLKKIIMVCFIPLVGTLNAQTNNELYNPFKSIGQEVKTLTLSDGKYNEFFDTDSIEIIGSAVFNTNTMKVIAFVEYDTAYSEATLEPEIVSRFLSQDPLGRMFPMLTPYQYASNTPIQAIDLDGLEALKVVGEIDMGDFIVLQVSGDPDVRNNVNSPFQFTFRGQTFTTDNIGTKDFGFKEIQKQIQDLKVVDNELIVNGKSVARGVPTGDVKNPESNFANDFTFGIKVSSLTPNTTINVDVPTTSNFAGVSGNFGTSGNTAQFAFTAPASSTNATFNINVNSSNTDINSFTVFGSDGSAITPTRTAGLLTFAIPSGSNFTVNVTGLGGDANDLFDFSGSVTTTTSVSVIDPD